MLINHNNSPKILFQVIPVDNKFSPSICLLACCILHLFLLCYSKILKYSSYSTGNFLFSNTYFYVYASTYTHLYRLIYTFVLWVFFLIVYHHFLLIIKHLTNISIILTCFIANLSLF